MALQNQERIPESLKQQLALAVRSIQWSYAIFWSLSTRQLPGVLEWRDGYYNGDIKTRKTIQAVELNANQLGLQRSEQLRELYESLSTSDSNPQARRPSAALSPEDLTDTEWYYLVCMSFVFSIGEGMPGRTYASGQPIWLCNAHSANSNVFSRSLLAKSAGIQTIVCFPFLGGVIELGVTERIMEDLSLIQHIKTSFLEIPCHIGLRSRTKDSYQAYNSIETDLLDTKVSPFAAVCERLEIASPGNSSDEFDPTNPGEGSFMVEGINGAASQVQSWQIMEEEFSNCIHPSLTTSDCISQTFVDHRNAVVRPPKPDTDYENRLQEVQECNQTKLTSLDLRNDDLHYQNVLSSLLKTSHQLIMGPSFHHCNKESSFVSWRKSRSRNQLKPRGTSQKMLKKILFEVPRMHDHELLESPKSVKDSAWRPEADEISKMPVLSERVRIEKMNEKFMILKSLLPSFSKDDKVALLDDTIEYLQDLERKVQELESFQESPELEPRTKRKPQDTMERTSDNYGSNRITRGKKHSVNKRKACDIDEDEPEIDFVAMKDCSADNITVNVNNRDVEIEIRCPWKEKILLEIMDAMSHLHLDCHTVKSSTAEGIVSITVKSKYKGSNAASERMIQQALQRVASKRLSEYFY